MKFMHLTEHHFIKTDFGDDFDASAQGLRLQSVGEKQMTNDIV